PCATGRIGVQVERARLLRGVRAAVAALSPAALPAAAHAITTTDAFPKTAVRRLRLGGRPVTVAALGKGGGMIAPRMATLLVFVVTDARVAPAAAQRTLRAAVDGTLGRGRAPGGALDRRLDALQGGLPRRGSQLGALRDGGRERGRADRPGAGRRDHRRRGSRAARAAAPGGARAGAAADAGARAR